VYRRTRKDAPAGDLGNQRRKHREDKLIRPDDLIPKHGGMGAHQLLFSAIETTNN
jgi:hypothetical protein